MKKFMLTVGIGCAVLYGALSWTHDTLQTESKAWVADMEAEVEQIGQ